PSSTSARPRCSSTRRPISSRLFSSTHTSTTAIYTLSLHDALPISPARLLAEVRRTPPRQDQPHRRRPDVRRRPVAARGVRHAPRSEEHTSELQSRENLVCRLLLEKKNETDGKNIRYAEAKHQQGGT